MFQTLGHFSEFSFLCFFLKCFVYLQLRKRPLKVSMIDLVAQAPIESFNEILVAQAPIEGSTNSFCCKSVHQVFLLLKQFMFPQFQICSWNLLDFFFKIHAENLLQKSSFKMRCWKLINFYFFRICCWKSAVTIFHVNDYWKFFTKCFPVNYWWKLITQFFHQNFSWK